MKRLRGKKKTLKNFRKKIFWLLNYVQEYLLNGPVGRKQLTLTIDQFLNSSELGIHLVCKEFYIDLCFCLFLLVPVVATGGVLEGQSGGGYYC